ncbi:MAG: M20/M25/M40 family metallo-hydrolase [Synergistaceae bacterium]|nr:M20/M25/M40 family metallo-hydrolase [Synergistaceae bacterium]
MYYKFEMRRILCGIFVVLLLCGIASAAPKPYDVTVTPEQRALIHSKVDALKDDLVDVMITGATYDSISRGGTAATAYPFPVSNTTANQNEGMRKTAKYDWAYNMAKDLGFPRVVRYQPDKFFYAEIGDADAPEMIFALSHLDSPTASVNAANGPRWRDSTGAFNPDAYKMPYIKDGWIYGAGIQDDSGPTLATLMSMKALMEANLPFDRRIRVGMGAYEDGGPGTPSVANTLNYIDIPYYTANPGFYDNWAYKSLNREEIPISSFTTDSRFPIITGNNSSANRTISWNLSADIGKGFSLESAGFHVTDRVGDPTLVDLVGGSGYYMPSKSVFIMSIEGVNINTVYAFQMAVNNEAMAKGWSGRVVSVVDVEGKKLTLTVNTGKQIDAITPQYGQGGVTWGMYFLSKGFEAIKTSYPEIDGLLLKKVADTLVELFMPSGVENFYGAAFGLEARHPDSLAPMMTVSLGVLQQASAGAGPDGPAYHLNPMYPMGTGANANTFQIVVYARSMYATSAEFSAAQQKFTEGFTDKGWTIGNAPSFTAPNLYIKHDNILNSVLMASYRNSVAAPGLEDIAQHNAHAYPNGTTGGTLARNFWNNMTTFGAILPGNERWFHAANERMTILAAVQTTKICADAMVEMARYISGVGSQLMWADIPGYNADRADLDLVDVNLDTYIDAKAAVPASALGGYVLAAATAFDIPMYSGRIVTERTDAQIALGHASGGIYLPLNDADYLSKEFVLPMRLEFKLTKDGLGAEDDAWEVLRDSSLKDFISKVKFGIVRSGAPVALTLPSGTAVEKVFYKRVSERDPNSLYVSINIAVADTTADANPRFVLANSKTDLFKLNPAYEAANSNPWPDRGKVTERGFFLFGDGAKDAHFISPEAVYMTISPKALVIEPDKCLPDCIEDLLDCAGCNAGFGALIILALGLLLRKK